MRRCVRALSPALRHALAPSPRSTSDQRATKQRDDLGSVSAASTYTLVRESSGAITSKEGFSVVAPISTMLPDST
jgi:hypothetical protein